MRMTSTRRPLSTVESLLEMRNVRKAICFAHDARSVKETLKQESVEYFKMYQNQRRPFEKEVVETPMPDEDLLRWEVILESDSEHMTS